MLPGNVDPRRPDKVHRYKPPAANANGQGEDLTPDYMNILGQRATTANASSTEPEKHVVVVEGTALVNPALAAAVTVDAHLQAHHQQGEESTAHLATVVEDPMPNSNVIPTSSQYGVAIIPSQGVVVTSDVNTETVTLATDTITDTTAKQLADDGKDLQSTPSRNDRFKVVKIASLEPFKRGRWKCMDYVDEAPPPASQQAQSKVSQSATNIPVATGGVYLQTQSLPQQQIQQMLLQSGYTNGTQFFQNVPAQMMPQAQYFYPPGANMQTQTLPQQLVNATGVPSSMPAQFINTNQPYFTTGVVQNSAGYPMTANYPNVQYVPANLLQNQGSAFVPTSQTVQLPTNFQQSQTYAGQPNVNQPLVNGHAYPQQNEQQQQQVTASLPTQAAKNVILNTNTQQPVVTSQPQISQPNIQNQIPVVQSSTQSQSVPVIQNQQYQQQQNTNFQQVPPNQTQNAAAGPQPTMSNPQVQNFDQNQANNVYTNPQFDINVNSLTVLENPEASNEAAPEAAGSEAGTGDNPDDPSKTNPVVNAIDNKIEQAMDLVKSHLMYTVREEVEVLKEKIAELMERIQQLETENNFLRSQIPKGQAAGAPPPAAAGSGSAPPATNPPSTTSSASNAASNETSQQ